MKTLYAALFQSLAAPDPMPQITDIQKSVNERALNAISNKVWPYDPDPLPSEDRKIDADLKQAVDGIRARFMTNWAPPPPGVT